MDLARCRDGDPDVVPIHPAREADQLRFKAFGTKGPERWSA
jgi:hypothetical protein